MKGFVQATAVAGTLDILAAAGLTLFYGQRGVDDMLRFVASGPFPGATAWGTAGALLGLVVHFALMAIMVGAYFWTAQRWPQLTAQPVKWGVIYGVVTYVAMNLIVVPARFGSFPHTLRADPDPAVLPHRARRHSDRIDCGAQSAGPRGGLT